MVGGVTEAILSFAAGRFGNGLGWTTSMPFFPGFAPGDGLGVCTAGTAGFAMGFAAFEDAEEGAFLDGEAAAFFAFPDAALAMGFFTTGFALVTFTGLRDVPAFFGNLDRPQLRDFRVKVGFRRSLVRGANRSPGLCACQSKSAVSGPKQNPFKIWIGSTYGSRRGSVGLDIPTHLSVSLVPLFHDRADRNALETLDRLYDPTLHGIARGTLIAMGPAHGFGDDLVDDAQLQVVARGELERLRRGRVGLLVGFLPQDGRATFGADDRVPRVLEHGDLVGHRDSQSSARTSFADDDTDDRSAQAAHFQHVHGDRFGLSALLSTEPGIGPWRVHEGHDGNAILLRELHFGERFAIPLGVGTPKVARQLFAGFLSLLVPDEHDLHWSDACEASHDRRIVPIPAISVQLGEVPGDHPDVISCLRTEGMAGDAHGLPCREFAVQLAEEIAVALTERLEVAQERSAHLVGRGGIGPDGGKVIFQLCFGLIDLDLDFLQGLLEVELIKRGHDLKCSANPSALLYPMINLGCLAVIGGGNMGEAIVRGTIACGLLKPAQIVVSDPFPERRALFDAMGIRATGSIGACVRQLAESLAGSAVPGAVLLAVKPQMLDAVAGELAPAILEHLPQGITIVSILAGTPIFRLQSVLGVQARIVRAMPNLPARVRQSATAVCLAPSATNDDERLATQLFEAVGPTVVRVDESLMDAFTALAGSGPAYLFYLAEAMTRSGRELGFDYPTAAAVVRQTLLGAALLLNESSEDPDTLRAAVTSRGGTTAAAVHVLDRSGAMQSWMDAMRAARDRGAELSRGD